MLLITALLIGSTLARQRKAPAKTKPTNALQREAGACFAPHFACPQWAPCCSKEGFCGNTADYCDVNHCFKNCWHDADLTDDHTDDDDNEEAEPVRRTAKGRRTNVRTNKRRDGRRDSEMPYGTPVRRPGKIGAVYFSRRVDI